MVWICLAWFPPLVPTVSLHILQSTALCYRSLFSCGHGGADCFGSQTCLGLSSCCASERVSISAAQHCKFCSISLIPILSTYNRSSCRGEQFVMICTFGTPFNDQQFTMIFTSTILSFFLLFLRFSYVLKFCHLVLRFYLIILSDYFICKAAQPYNSLLYLICISTCCSTQVSKQYFVSLFSHVLLIKSKRKSTSENWVVQTFQTSNISPNSPNIFKYIGNYKCCLLRVMH